MIIQAPTLVNKKASVLLNKKSLRINKKASVLLNKKSLRINKKSLRINKKSLMRVNKTASLLSNKASLKLRSDMPSSITWRALVTAGISDSETSSYLPTNSSSLCAKGF